MIGRLPGRSPVKKAGRFGGDNTLSYQGGVNKGQVEKCWVNKKRVVFMERGSATPGGA